MVAGFSRGGGVSRFSPPRRTQRPRPPAIFQTGKRRIQLDGPGEPPVGFVSGTTSLSEWYIYWAFLKVKGPEGESSWGFQIDAGGGRGRRGGAVIDFVVWDQEPRLAIRIQTERYHIAVRQQVQTFDETSKRMLERLGYKVIDIYEEHFIRDKSGRMSIILVREALQGKQRPSPLTLPQSRARPGAT